MLKLYFKKIPTGSYSAPFSELRLLLQAPLLEVAVSKLRNPIPSGGWVISSCHLRLFVTTLPSSRELFIQGHTLYPCASGEVSTRRYH